MQLQLLDGDGKLICEMDKDSATLGSYPVENGYKIHVCCHERVVTPPGRLALIILPPPSRRERAEPENEADACLGNKAYQLSSTFSS